MSTKNGKITKFPSKIYRSEPISWSKKDSEKLHSGKVPIYRGCTAAKNGGCMCDGAYHEIIGYRDKQIGEIK